MGIFKKILKGKKKIVFLIILIIISLFPSRVIEAQDRLLLATTTSTENSGLLDELLPPFEEKYDVRVDVVSVGTGQAINHGENGDADIILVHAEEAEKEFIEEGYGVNRRDVMYNDFVILGPEEDPANIEGLEDASLAFEKIADSESTFVSRGDNSGTHMKELAIWEEAGIEPNPPWYLEAGQGMGATLNMAHEQEAYILADRGTYLAYMGDIDLKVLTEGDEILHNPYGIIPVNPELHPHVNYQMAMALLGFITSPEGQSIINEFLVEGEQLFHSSAIIPENIE